MIHFVPLSIAPMPPILLIYLGWAMDPDRRLAAAQARPADLTSYAEPTRKAH
jgi:hypothetical protein